MKMPFGKFRGYPVSELPREYLEWLTENIDLREPLASAVEAALSSGGDDRALSYSGNLPPELKPIVSEIVSAGYRTVARRLHPDAGGRHEDMQKLNAARDWLRKLAA